MNRIAITTVAVALTFGAPPAMARDDADLEDTIAAGLDAANNASDRVNALADAGYCAAVKGVSDSYWSAIIAADELHDHLEEDGAYNEAETRADLIRSMMEEAESAYDIYDRNC